MVDDDGTLLWEVDQARGGNQAHTAPEVLAAFRARHGLARRIPYANQPVWAAGVVACELAGGGESVLGDYPAGCEVDGEIWYDLASAVLPHLRTLFGGTRGDETCDDADDNDTGSTDGSSSSSSSSAAAARVTAATDDFVSLLGAMLAPRPDGRPSIGAASRALDACCDGAGIFAIDDMP